MSNDRITELLEEILAELKRQNTPYPSLPHMPAPYYPPEQPSYPFSPVWCQALTPSFEVTATGNSTVQGTQPPEVQG